MALRYDYTALDTEGWTKGAARLSCNLLTMMYLDIKDITVRMRTRLFSGLCFFKCWVLDHVQELFRGEGKSSQLDWLQNQHQGEEPRFKFIRRWVN